MNPRFLQIHTLSPYTGALLNRDDSGLAKRLPYGGALRTRISSQCLKRHWRMASDPHALKNIAEQAVRSRDLVAEVARKARLYAETWNQEAAEALDPWFLFAIYGSKAADAPKKRGEKSKFEDKGSRPTLLFGRPEIKHLSGEYARLMSESGGDPDRAFELAKDWVGGSAKKAFLSNMKAMREATDRPAGIAAALFGRMVTSDPAANITAPVHVAHAFTVHREEAESDYFTAVDDLSEDEPGADTIQDTELTSSLFYGYVVVDLPGLIENLSGDLELAGLVLHNLVHLIAEVSPGAKLGSTAPYSRASVMLLEAGDRQPCSLAEAYRTPCAPKVDEAAKAMSEHLRALDEQYATGEERRVLSLAAGVDFAAAQKGTLADLAVWAQGLPARVAQ